MSRYFATVARGLEEVAAHELQELGAEEVELGFTGVSFKGNRELLYRVNLWARTLFRVLVPVYECPSPNADVLYHEVRKFDWSEHLHPGKTLAVDCTGGNDRLNHTHFTALQVKNAIVDQQRDRYGRRSSVDVQDPNLRLNIHVHGNRSVLSLDSSGDSLHRRGYRPAVGIAPLKETLAAALLDMAGWQPGMAFVDPLCGSGTLPLEAGLKALDVAPGLLRDHFAFERWPDHDEGIWQRLLVEARERCRSELGAPILGSDNDEAVLDLARGNAHRCGLERLVQFTRADLDQIEAPAASGILIANPPYGERMGEIETLAPLYRQLGDLFKQRFKGWTAYVITGNRELAKQIGLKASKRIPVFNGQLPCTFLKYELY